MPFKFKRLTALLLTGMILLPACSSEESKIVAYVKTDADKQKNFEITYQDFMTEYRFNLKGEGLDENSEEDGEALKEIRQTIIDYLTSERVRLQAAEDLGIGASSLTSEEQEEIVKNSEEVLEQFAESFISDAEAELGKNADENALNEKAKELSEKYFTDAGLSPDIVYVWQRNWTVEQKLIDLIIADVAVDESETEDMVNEYTEAAKSVYESSPESYNTETDYHLFYIPENSRKTRIILIAFSSERTQQLSNLRTIGESENADKLREDFASEIKEKTDEAYEKLETDIFVNVMNEYSDDVSGMEDYPGGYVITPESEFLSYDYNTGKSFTDTVYSLSETGTYTEPILTDYGYIVAEYSSDALVDANQLEYIKEQIKNSLLENAQSVKFAEMEAEWNETYPYIIDYKALGLSEPTE